MSNEHLPRSGGIWPVAGFLLGWWLMPTGRARNLYCYSFFAIIGGLLVMDFDTSPGHGSKQPWEVMTPTIWSWLLWAFGTFCLVLLIGEIRAARRARRTAAVEPVELQEAPEAPAAQPTAAVPATAAPAPAPKRPTPTRNRLIMASTTDSGLHLPSYTRRRVRRGGQTLSGTPIKDRRTVDPRSL